MNAPKRDIGFFLVCAAVSAVTGCGGSKSPMTSSEATRTPTVARPLGTEPPARPVPHARAGILVSSPRFAATLHGQERGSAMTAVIRLAGEAAPRAALELIGTCDKIDCDEIAFADAHGRWKKDMQLTSRPGSRSVGLRVGYAEPGRGDRPITTRFRLVTTPPPTAASDLLPAASAGGGPGGPRPVVVIGDSLAVGMAAYLQADLAGWHVGVDGRIGRPLAEGMQVLAGLTLPPATNAGGVVLAFSLFTNDAPQNVDALEAAVRASIARAGPRGCAVWATIARPPLGGVTYDGVNERLHALAGDARLAQHLVLVPWAEAYAAHPEWQAGDGVHATGAGYAARATLYADAVRSCPA